MSETMNTDVNTDAAANGALLAIWHDVEETHVDEYLRWHSFEHLPERLALPGFECARRFERVAGAGPRFLCLVDTVDLAAFSTEAYLARLNAPTPWTRAMMPRYSNVDRALCRCVFAVGGGTAPLLCCVRFNLRRGDAGAALPGELLRQLGALHAEQRLTHVQLCATDAALSARKSEEARLRGTEQTGERDYLVVLAGVLAADVSDAARAVVQVLADEAQDLTVAHYGFSYAAARGGR